MTSQGWGEWIGGLRRGDPAILEEFYARYGNPLERLADRHLSSGVRRRVGADDIVQSVCRTFFRRAGGGQFEFADAEDLWRLLCAITVNKVRGQARFHGRQKRSVNRERSLEAPDRAEGLEATPDEAIALAEEVESLLRSIDEEWRRIVDLKLQNLSNAEIAERLGCSERTVRRLLVRVKDHLTGLLDAGPD